MLHIDESSAVPIYEQVYKGITELIVKGVYGPGHKLPSVRELASELRINPNTIQKTYRQLEADHYVTSVKGKGNFVNEEVMTHMVFKDAVKKRLETVVKELHMVGLTEKEIHNLVTDIINIKE